MTSFGYNTLGFGSFPNRFKPFHYYFIATDSGTEGLYGTEDFATIELVNASLPAAPQSDKLVYMEAHGILAFTSGRSYYYSVDGGLNWTTVENVGPDTTLNIATDGTNVVLRRGNTAAGTDNENYYSTNGTSFTEGAALFRYPGVLSFANGYFFINGRQNNYSPAQFYGYSSDGGENWTNQSTTSEQPWYQSGSLSQVNDGSGMVWDGTNYYIAGYSYNSNAAAEISVSNGAVRDDGWVMTNLHGNYSGVFSLAATSDLVIAGGFFVDGGASSAAKGTLWYSDDNGSNWARQSVLSGTGNFITFGGGNDRLYFKTNTAEIYVTTDGSDRTRLDSESFTAMGEPVSTQQSTDNWGNIS
jgi:hypothetical protein|tara:strand:+ start:151 stop:1221 length:1071 start_codon:yes stop_codon:yes gene_type:complete